MSYKLLTNLLFEPRGKHNPSLTYNIKDTVMSEDGSKVYFALDNVPAGIPLTDTNYWMLQMDLSASKNAMDTAAANARTQTDATISSANTRVEDMMGKAAEAVTSVADYAAKVGMRVKGETKISKGNPMTIYPDGGSLLKVQTDIPIKQLGSGDPYPAGGGKNLMPPRGESITANGITITANADGSATYNGTATANLYHRVSDYFKLAAGEYILSGCAQGSSSATYFMRLVDSTQAEIGFDYGAGYRTTFTTESDILQVHVVIAKGLTVSNLTFYPMIRLASDPDSTYAPYSNIRPFIGYDKLNLGAAGKNLCNPDEFTQGDLSEGRYLTNSVDTNNVSGYVPVSPNTTYTRSSNCVSGSREIALYDANKIFLSRTFGETFTTPSNCYFVRLEWESTYPLTESWFQLEIGSTPSAYAPYQGNTLHTVQLGRTVCSGRFDWLTGKLTDGIPPIEFDGDEVVSTDGGGIFTTGAFREASEAYGEIQCSHYTSVRDYESFMSTDMSVCVWASGQIRIHDSRFNSVSEINAYYAAEKAAGTPVQIVYKLATPIEIQLAPNVITAVEDGGVNHIYGDADLTVEWVKPLETSITEHSNAKVDANNEALLMDVAQKERSVGNPVVISDAVANVAFPHVETVLMPKQAGSGDPYPAGGGRNLCPYVLHNEVRALRLLAGHSYVVSISDASASDITLLLYNDGTGASYFRSVPIDRAESGRRYGTFTLDRDTTHINFTWGTTATLIEPQIEDGSTPTEYAPYENIRPITGYDKLELSAAGKNLFNLNQTYDYFVDTIITGDVITTTFSSNGALHIKEGDIHPAGVYTLTIVPVSGFEGFTGWLYYADNDEEKKISPFNASNLTATIVADRPFKIGFGGIYGHPEHTCSYKVQLEVGSDSTAYAPYQGALHTVQIGETVYGGHYNWLTGKLVAEWARVELDGTEYWKSDGNWFYLLFDNLVKTSNYTDVVKCSHFVASINQAFIDLSAGGISGYYNPDVEYPGKNWIYARFSGADTVEKHKAYLAAQKVAGTPVQIAYKLAQPIEIQLDPTRITTISGTNTIFGDGEFMIDWFKSYKKVAEERENLLLDSFTDKAELSGNPITMTPVGGISFDSVVTEFSLKQSGSGDPYPAGGGKNLLPNTATTQTINGVTFTVNADGTVVANGTATANAVFRITCNLSVGETYTMSGCPAGGSTSTYFMQIGNFGNDTGSGVTAAATENTGSSVALLVMSGYTASNIVFKPQLEFGDVSTSYAPYSNIRPITGYDKLELNQNGAQLLDDTNLSGIVLKSAHYFDNPFKSPGVYTATINITGGTEQGITVSFNSATGNIKQYTVQNGKPTLIEVTEDILRQLDHCAIYTWRGSVGATLDWIMVNAGNTALPYAPYQHKLHTVQIGQTVYGGKLDWLTGKLTAEWAMVTLTDNHGFYLGDIGEAKRLTVVNVIPGADNEGNSENVSLYCTHYKVHHAPIGSNNVNNAICGYLQDGNVYIRDDRFNTYEEAAAYFAAQNTAGTPVQIAYKLATPIEIQLTPTEIRALSGVNTLYGDGDTITAKFRQSKDVDILKRLSALETLMTNQTKGE